QQLMRRSWYLATLEFPGTCATFSLCNTFHKMTLEGKCTSYNYHKGITKLSNNLGHLDTKVCGNDGVRKVEETRQGELVVLCPACPHPGINLPDNWSNPNNPKQWLYMFFLAIDACFRLKRKLISTHKKYPPLQPGWAYMVDPKPYQEYLLSVTDQDEMSTCTGLAALDYANTKFSKGYAQTRLGMCCWAQHEMVRKNAAGALQKGERYSNMDYIVASWLRHLYHLLALVLSYDIVCQWSKRCISRMAALPPNVRLHAVFFFIKFVIPKLHIYGHKLACQILYSLNFMKGVGRTDVEGIEHTWANMGPVATSTKEMGPGSSLDALEDHLGHWNWGRLSNLVFNWSSGHTKHLIQGKLLHKRCIVAIQELALQEASLEWFSGEQIAEIPLWRQAVEDFEDNPSKPNPFELPSSGTLLYLEFGCFPSSYCPRHGFTGYQSSNCR
ncbi:hypothetical protein BT96DRAFT_843349, partial [Gymnopus androsaceus JB14]